MKYSAVAKAVGHGLECVVTLGGFETLHDARAVEDVAVQSATTTFRQFFAKEPETVGVTSGADNE